MNIEDLTDDEIFEAFDERGLDYEKLSYFESVTDEDLNTDVYEENVAPIRQLVDCKRSGGDFDALFSELAYQFVGVIV